MQIRYSLSGSYVHLQFSKHAARDEIIYTRGAMGPPIILTIIYIYIYIYIYTILSRNAPNSPFAPENR
jgi:hypothetical protein